MCSYSNEKCLRTDWHSPASEEIFMDGNFAWGGVDLPVRVQLVSSVKDMKGNLRRRECTATHLPGNRISGHSRNPTIPKPLQDLYTGFHAGVLRLFLSRILLFLLVGESVPFGNDAGADEKDVAFSWGHVLVLADG
jgi:hypothetical protein